MYFHLGISIEDITLIILHKVSFPGTDTFLVDSHSVLSGRLHPTLDPSKAVVTPKRWYARMI